MRALGLVVGWWALAAAGAAAAENTVDFAREVQPILAKRCYQCHGPNAAKGGLRLHAEGPALGKAESGEPAIVPGKAAASELVRRIASENEDDQMPPEGKRLTAAEQALIRRWIDEGARFQQHWAFTPPVKRALPAVKNEAWAASPIDRFVLAGLEGRELAPPPPAEKAALLRRATYAVTGLPPTWEETQAFLADARPEAYEKAVDRLLASERYGEHWARKWLDVVRFAETNSYERDNPKPFAWRYRDYVIRALNSDKPYDLFVREQIAGDEFPAPTNDALTGTGFYRLGLCDEEPTDRLQARFDELDDIVTTTCQALLGLTVNCARCHDHKIDPFPQQNYYQLLSFFHNIRPYVNGGPNVEVPLFADEGARVTHAEAVRKLEADRNRARLEMARIEALFAQKQKDGAGPRARDIDDLQYKFYRDTWRMLPDFSQLKPEDAGALPEGLISTAPATRKESYGFVYEGKLIVPADGEYTFYLDSDDGSRLTLAGKLALEYDGVHGVGQEKRATIRLAAGAVPLKLEYFQGLFGQGLSLAWSGPNFARRSLSQESAGPPGENKNLAALIAADAGKLLGADEFERYARAKTEFDSLAKKTIPVEMALCVTENGPAPPETFILARGNPATPGDRVQPGFPEVLGGGAAIVPPPAAGAKSSGRRTALAAWLTARENRLTARVMVNRVWQHHFGRGIVRTPNNFGLGGTPPTHPELLDWLAVDFMEQGWRLKTLHKQILLSNAFRMSSAASEAALRVDPANDLFSRFDLRRLTAEELRDSVLAASGALNTKMFGPGVFPEIEAEVLAGQSRPGAGWGKSSPEEAARRSVYIHVKRSLVTPLLATFDFPETDFTCEARFATTQPSQSLSLLNGRFMNEQASMLAARVAKAAPTDPAARIQAAHRLVLTREATPDEVARGTKLVQDLRARRGQSEESAWKYYCLTVLNRNEFLYLD